MVEITPELHLPDEELVYVAARSGGPGGQNVNKLETKVTLRFDLAGSPSLSEDQRRRIAERLPTRISRAGVLQVSSQRHRTQAANRAAALERFCELLQEALAPEIPRRPTRMPRAARRRRRSDKVHHSRRKRERSAPIPVD